MNFEEKAQQEYLYDMYWKEEKSFRTISKELKIPLTTLWVIFEDLGIRARTKKKSVRLWWKKKLKDGTN